MKHYHGTPIGGARDSVARLLKYSRRFFLVRFGRAEDLPIVMQESAGFCLDNGAFSAWRTGSPIEDWQPYFDWVKSIRNHPRFDFAIIPDVIDGDEQANDELLKSWNRQFAKYHVEGVPVWHLHESTDRLHSLCRSNWRRVALGSSGEYSTPGTQSWWQRVHEFMPACCDEHGAPVVKLHGLRMLKRQIVERLPLASADSTTMAQNKKSVTGPWAPPNDAQRAECIASNLEASTSPPTWIPYDQTQDMFDWFRPEVAAG